jgi:hypothetical protein
MCRYTYVCIQILFGSVIGAYAAWTTRLGGMLEVMCFQHGQMPLYPWAQVSKIVKTSLSQIVMVKKASFSFNALERPHC